jgi:hypothetical protein
MASAARLRLIVLGTLASNPYAGMAWMHMQIAAGLRRLGHDVYYFEVTSTWPYDPARSCKVCDSDYAVPYLARVAAGFGLEGRWAYRRSYSDNEWLGLGRSRAEELLASADAVLNISGATRIAEEGLPVGRLVYIGTDPGYHEIMLANGDDETRALIAQHDDCVTYGENIGSRDCPIPELPRLRARMRQPVLVDLWRDGTSRRSEFTTVTNWRQEGRDVAFQGKPHFWSKDREFLKFLELPSRTGQPFELAMNLAEPGEIRHDGQVPREADPVRTLEVSRDIRSSLLLHGWRLVHGPSFTTDPWAYLAYIQSSRGEFTVARELNVGLRSGWFSERSACYLAAGRPVITQDTGFGCTLPIGEGLFAFQTVEDILAAVDAVNSDYERHSRAALALAEDYFRAETVLSRLLADLDL